MKAWWNIRSSTENASVADARTMGKLLQDFAWKTPFVLSIACAQEVDAMHFCSQCEKN